MINITHSLWWINLILILLSFWIIWDASIWIILLSIFLWQVMDLDHWNAWISKKFWLRSLSKTVCFLVQWHRRETHSFFYSALVALILIPLSFYLSIVDWSSILGNSLVIFFAVLSHWLLDMANLSPIPLFYVPIINPVWKARMYTYFNFLENIALNIWELFNSEKIKIFSKNLHLKWGLKVSSDNEFKFVTLPLMILFFVLVFENWNYIQSKIFEWSELIINNIIFSLIIIIFSVRNNYFFKEEWGFKDFIYSIINNLDKPSYWRMSDLKKLFWEWNFTKIFTFIIVIYAIWLHPTEYLNNWLNFLYWTKEFIVWKFTNEDNIIKQTIEFFNYILF